VVYHHSLLSWQGDKNMRRVIWKNKLFMIVGLDYLRFYYDYILTYTVMKKIKLKLFISGWTLSLNCAVSNNKSQDFTTWKLWYCYMKAINGNVWECTWTCVHTHKIKPHEWDHADVAINGMIILRWVSCEACETESQLNPMVFFCDNGDEYSTLMNYFYIYTTL